MPWIPFVPGGSFVTAASLDFVDPCLAWAEAQGFADQLRPGDPLPARVPAVLELRAGQTPAMLQTVLSGLPGGSAVRPHYVGVNTTYCSAWLSPAACVALASAAHPVVRRFEFVAAMLPRPIWPNGSSLRRAPVRPRWHGT